MSPGRWERWSPASGIVYVVLFLIALFVAGDDPGDSDEEILSYYADSGNRAQDIAGFFLLVLAALFFLWFVGTLRNRLRSAEGGEKGLSALAFGAGVASAALLIAAAALFVSISGTIEDSDEFRLDPNVFRVVSSIGYVVWVGSTMVASVLVTATSLLALKTAVLPKWLGWVGLFAALVLLVAIFFFPIFVLWAWVLLVSIFLIVRGPIAAPQERVESATAEAASS